VLGGPGRIAAGAIRKEEERDPVRHPERLDVAAEGRDPLPAAGGIATRPEQLQPVRLDPEVAQAEEVLERHPEIPASGRVLRDEGGADEDGTPHLHASIRRTVRRQRVRLQQQRAQDVARHCRCSSAHSDPHSRAIISEAKRKSCDRRLHGCASCIVAGSSARIFRDVLESCVKTC